MAATLIDAGCDAISVTANEGTEAQKVIEGLYEQWFIKERQRGMDVSDIAPSGYRGNQCGGVFYGTRANHTLAQFRGEAAKAAADRLAALRVRPHVTRLDWQATFRPPCTEAEAVRRYRRLIDDATSRSGQEPQGRGIVHQTRDLANSYNLVSGGGLSYWRTYNKHRESNGAYPPNTWRPEWQIKGKRALHSWGQFCESRNQPEYALAVLRGQLLKYGMDEPCLREVCPVDVTKGKHKSDTAKRLEWMDATVSAVVGKLLADGVTMAEIVDILTKPNGIKGRFQERGTLESDGRV